MTKVSDLIVNDKMRDDAVTAMINFIASLKSRRPIYDFEVVMDTPKPEEEPMSLALQNLKNFLEHIDSFSPGIKPHDDMPVRGYAPQSWLTIGDLREVVRLAEREGRGAITEVVINQAGGIPISAPAKHFPKPNCPSCGMGGNAVVPSGGIKNPWECLPCGKVFA